MTTEKFFSHVKNFTKYMSKVYNIVEQNKSKQKILDIPAGNGLLLDKLKANGHEVVYADINQERENYIFVDMEKKLSFNDEEFDTVICMEGLEHLIIPANCIAELCRITKKGGRIIISLPNIHNINSRVQFLCTGILAGFEPSTPPFNYKNRVKTDLGHITPLSFIQLRWLFKYHDADLKYIEGDRFKRKYLIPFLVPFILIGLFWIKKTKWNREWLFNKSVLFSRSLILVFDKK